MTEQPSYRSFLEEKFAFQSISGFEIDPKMVNPRLKPHIRGLVPWGLKGGRRAFFLDFGLAKTSLQIELMRIISLETGEPTLINLPLGVRQEFFNDALKLFRGKFKVRLKFIRDASEIETGHDRLNPHPIYITNYETVRDGKLDPVLFVATSLDEAAVLRDFGSKTYQEFLPLFEKVPYRFVATATPAPNKLKELIHYAAFLGIMDSGEALTRWFQRNSEKANDLTLYPHKETEFWLWVHSWAVFLQKPSDLGYSDAGYELPKFTVHWHEVPSDHAAAGPDQDGQHLLLANPAAGVQAAAAEKRSSLGARVERLLSLVTASPEPEAQWVLWCDLNDEQAAIARGLKAIGRSVTSLTGAQDIAEREPELERWKARETLDFLSKPSMYGAGTNLQQAWQMAFAGVGYQFHDFIQAMHRVVRFGQTHEVAIHVVHSEAERPVVDELKRKWREHDEMRAKMSAIIREHGLDHGAALTRLRRSIGVARKDAQGEGWWAANNDTVEELPRIPEKSVGLVLSSIPFEGQYEYVASYNDFGHCSGRGAFWRQMDYLTPNLFRILQPGRLACIHVKDRILFGNVTGEGVPTVSPFHAEAIFHYLKHGFQFMGMITIVTDVVRENNATNRLGYGEMMKDGTKMGVGSPEYVLMMRRPQSDKSRGYADVPVVKDPAKYSLARWQVDAHAFWRSSGNRLLSTDELISLGPKKLAAYFPQWSVFSGETYDHEQHVRIGEEIEARRPGALPRTFMALAPGSAHPGVWHDVNRMQTLNSQQALRRVEKHICLARGSLVLTRDGYKEIQDVKVGDQVLTHHGRWRPVTVVRNTGVRPVVTLKAHGVPGLTLTPEHKVWTRKVRNTPWAKAKSRQDAMKRAPQWVRADKTAGSYINLRLPDMSVTSPVDDGVWWIAGRWIADGHIGARGEVVISCGRHELDQLVKRLGWRAGTVHDSGTSWQIRVKDLGGRLRAVLAQCGRGAGEKQLPPEALSLPIASAKALLDGYLSGDGHHVRSRRRWMATTISRKLAFGIAHLAQHAYSAIATIHAGRPAGTATIQGRRVNTRQEWTVSFDVPHAKRRILPMILADGAWKKVRSVVPAGEVETWCLRVEEDESFTAEGCIVKNCPLQFDIIDRLIDRYSNPGDMVFDPFLGIGSTIVRALKKKRRGSGCELSGDSFRDAVHYARATEREVSVPDLFGIKDEKEAA